MKAYINGPAPRPTRDGIQQAIETMHRLVLDSDAARVAEQWRRVDLMTTEIAAILRSTEKANRIKEAALRFKSGVFDALEAAKQQAAAGEPIAILGEKAAPARLSIWKEVPIAVPPSRPMTLRDYGIDDALREEMSAFAERHQIVLSILPEFSDPETGEQYLLIRSVAMRNLKCEEQRQIERFAKEVAQHVGTVAVEHVNERANVPYVATQEDADRLWGKGAAPDMKAMARIGGKVALVPLKRPKPDKVEVGQMWSNATLKISRGVVCKVGVYPGGGYACEFRGIQGVVLTDAMLSQDSWEYIGMEERSVGEDAVRAGDSEYSNDPDEREKHRATLDIMSVHPAIPYWQARAKIERAWRHRGSKWKDVNAKSGADVRAANIAEAQRLIDDCPEWAYPKGWMLAVMAVCEWCNNRQEPTSMARRWGQMSFILHRYHHARRDGLTCASAIDVPRSVYAHIPRNDPWFELLTSACEAYERGRR